MSRWRREALVALTVVVVALVTVLVRASDLLLAAAVVVGVVAVVGAALLWSLRGNNTGTLVAESDVLQALMEGRSEWKEARKALPLEARMKIYRAKRNGRALPDPRLAALAIGALARERRQLGSPSTQRILWFMNGAFWLLIGCINLVGAVVGDGLDVWEVVMGASWAALGLAFLLHTPRLIARSAEADQANRAVVARLQRTR